MLQSDVAKQSDGSPVCQLCHQEPEDLVHFLLTCTFLRPERDHFLYRLKNILPVYRNSDVLQIIIDCTMPPLQIPNNLQDDVESLTRSYIYVIHTKRSTQLGSRQPSTILRGSPYRGGNYINKEQGLVDSWIHKCVMLISMQASSIMW